MKNQTTCFVLLLAGALWAWWDTLQDLVQRWSRDPQYSHGYLVPAAACVLLWFRRDKLAAAVGAGSWWGVPLLVLSLLMRWAGVHYYFDWLDAASILPCLAGICLVAFGVNAFRVAAPVILFMIFMIPLPYRIEMAIQYPLRQMATVGGVYSMQTMGLKAFSHGNVITIGDEELGVAEACSGLSMLMVFLALSSAVAMMSTRPLWQRTVLFLSGVPIALVSNVARISVTGVLFAMNQSQLAHDVFHKAFGLLMMPLACGLLLAELWFLSRLVIIEEKVPVRFGLK